MTSKPVAAAIALALVCLAPAVCRAADVVTVGTVTASGTTVDVPVSIRDVSGTPLGMDRPAGSRIQSFSIKVAYSPAAAVSSVTFTRAGITASLSPTSEFSPSSPGAISLLATFKESTNPIPFTLNAASPGNRVAHLLVTLSSSAAPGSSIALTLDSSLTQLTDEGGSAATKETVANGQLALVNGAINVPSLSLSFTQSQKTVNVNSTGILRLTTGSPVLADTVVSLSSSNTGVARVSASVVIPAGSSGADVGVSGISVGTATITASISGGPTATATVNVVQPPAGTCTTPAAPQLSAPATAQAGQPYSVTWDAVTAATEYAVDEATDAEFTNATTTVVTGTSATFTHSDGRYYYRVRARNRAGSCDVTSLFSETVSVSIAAAPTPPPPPAAMRVLPVVGSAPGSFGSYFKTMVQLYNPKSVGVSGRIIYHPQGVSGTADDPSLSFSIAPGKTLSYADLLPAMGVASGVGTADIVADLTSPLPIVVARVFNDGGAAGTTGLTEEALHTDDALKAGQTGVLLAPADVTRFRLNVGIRTLEQGASMTVTVRDKDGGIVKTVTRSYGPTFFAQVGSAVLLDGFVLAGGETISFEVTAGSAFVYGSTTDNTTNDPNVQFARQLE